MLIFESAVEAHYIPGKKKMGTTKKADVARHQEGVQPRRLTPQLATRRTGTPFI
jgi:hypothetical protein